MMNGEVTVTSKLGQGSTFNIILKNIDVAVFSEEAPLIEEQFDPKSVIFEKGAILLIVDDVAANRSLVNGYLESYNITIYEAENGKEAINYAREYTPDLILMDMKPRVF